MLTNIFQNIPRFGMKSSWKSNFLLSKNFSTSKKPLFVKIMRDKENHYGYQYRDGLNILPDNFNDNPNNSCTKGGFYFTTPNFIHRYYNIGNNLRIIDLPVNDPEFKMVRDISGDKWRANRIILKEKYPLAVIETYRELNLKLPPLFICVENKFWELAKFVVRDRNEMNIELVHAAKNGHLEVVKYLIGSGADIQTNHNGALRSAARNGHLKIVKYLIDKGADVHAMDDYPLRFSLNNGHYDVAKYLIEKGADTNKIDKWHFDMIKKMTT